MVIFSMIFIQIIIFGIVLYALKKLMQGDTESAVNRLNESYADINKKKEELVAKIQQIEQEYQKRKEEAEKVANELREKVDTEISEKRDATLKKTREDAERIIAEATGATDRIRGEVRKEEQLNMIDYCSEILQVAFQDAMKQSINELLVDDFINDFAGIDTSHIPSDLKEVEVISCEKLSDTMKSKLEEAVKKKMKKSPPLKESEDKKLIAGIVIKFGSLVLDGSLSGKLKESATQIKMHMEEGT
ncbi:F0F1 ATP synthase subunit delta [Candidatus Omnitrophota bacterium]